MRRNFSCLTDLITAVDSTYRDVSSTYKNMQNIPNTPYYCVRKTDESFIVDVELAGVKKDDIKIKVLKDDITITAERSKNYDKKDVVYDNSGIFGVYELILKATDDVIISKLTATYNDGILTITIPKNISKAPKEQIIKIL